VRLDDPDPIAHLITDCYRGCKYSRAGIAGKQQGRRREDKEYATRTSPGAD
jgi:hypothetical protein